MQIPLNKQDSNKLCKIVYLRLKINLLKARSKHQSTGILIGKKNNMTRYINIIIFNWTSTYKTKANSPKNYGLLNIWHSEEINKAEYLVEKYDKGSCWARKVEKNCLIGNRKDICKVDQ